MRTLLLVFCCLFCKCIRAYEEQEEILALLKILALGNRELEQVSKNK